MKKLILFLALASLAAHAETAYLSIAQGPITFTSAGVSGKNSKDESVVGLYDNYVISGGAYYSDYVIKVLSGTHNITFNNVTINYPNVSPFDMSSGASVTLTLSGNNTLYMPYEKAGSPVHVPKGASLTIQGEGSLTACAMESSYGAGIGSVAGEDSGVITINGGTISARGDYFSAGIGGGKEGRGTVIITGGDITAEGLGGGAGIGGGSNTGGSGNYRSGSCDVTISGGRIHAKSENGAGIGHAWYSSDDPAGTVTITGGTIEAESSGGAGIGSGGLGCGPNVYISGGAIKASSIGHSSEASAPDPLNKVNGNKIYKATLPGAMTAPEVSGIVIMGASEEVSFTTQRNKAAYDYSYSGTGYTDTDDLYFYLPNGSYVITGSNKNSFGGTISDADATFVSLPEPAVLGLALLALAAFLRRK